MFCIPPGGKLPGRRKEKIFGALKEQNIDVKVDNNNGGTAALRRGNTASPMRRGMRSDRRYFRPPERQGCSWVEEDTRYGGRTGDLVQNTLRM